MDDVELVQTCLTTLEDVLVNEFRAYQTLVRLTKEERRVLSTADLPALEKLVGQKEALLAELSRLDTARGAAIQDWVHLTSAGDSSKHAPGANGRALTLLEILPGIEPATAKRMKRLREGILALVHQLRDLSEGNRALVSVALERLEAVRNFLVSLAEPPAYYQPQGTPQPVAAEAVLALEQWA
jgi:flagellar biosynthesis/type III secretory pathway chaperone